MNNKALIIMAAFSGGFLVNHFHIPAGAMVGAMLGTVFSQYLLNEKIRIPLKLKKIIRIVMGTFIGLGIAVDGISKINYLIFPLIIIIIGILLTSALVASVLHKIFKLDFADALLSSIPAGLSEMSMNSEELEGNLVVVTTIQLFRLLGILIIVPVLLKFII